MVIMLPATAGAVVSEPDPVSMIDDSEEPVVDLDPVIFDDLGNAGDPADFDWFIWEGNIDHVKMIDEFNSKTLTLPADQNGPFLAISPVDDEGVIVYKPLPFISAGSTISVDWAVHFEDMQPYIDMVSFYYIDEDGNTIPWFVKTIFDGTSGWNTEHFVAPRDSTYFLLAGAFNVFDETLNPILMIGNVSIEASTSPIPLPPAVLLLGSAFAGLMTLRRQKT